MSERAEPIPSYNFVVNVQGREIGWFTECAGLTVERTVIPQPEGGVNDYVHQLPGPISFSKITLKRGLADNVLWDWFRQGWYDGKVERRNVTITLLNPDHSEARHWDMAEAFPVRWTGPDFQADSAAVGVEALEIVAGGSSAQALIQRALGEVSQVLPVSPAASVAAAIDVTALAAEVYALMKQELTVERERSGRKWS